MKTLPELATGEVKDFIEFYDAIPEEKWNQDGNYFSPNDPSCRCAIGHLMIGGGYSPAKDRLYDLKREAGQSRAMLTDINDGGHPDYQQDSPKARVLAFLRDIAAQPVSA